MGQELAQKHVDKLEQIKVDILLTTDLDSENRRRFNRFRKFLFDTTIDSATNNKLVLLGKPDISFNILEAYDNRFLADVMKAPPSPVCEPKYELTDEDDELAQTITSYLRAQQRDADKTGFSWNTLSEMVSGGYSVIEVYPEYNDPYSFDVDIYLRKIDDPTLCGF